MLMNTRKRHIIILVSNSNGVNSNGVLVKLIKNSYLVSNSNGVNSNSTKKLIL